jgi:thioredoxin-related protein
MKVSIVLISFLWMQAVNAAPGDTIKLYNPYANAQKDIAAVVATAKTEKKFVILMAGGNWCSWCRLFNKTITEDKQLDSVMQANFIAYHLNYSDEKQK